MNQPNFAHVDLGFSVADAESIALAYSHQVLALSFTDWKENTLRILFDDTVAYRWQEAEYLLFTEERWDTTYEISDSAWIAQIKESAPNVYDFELRHIKLNFNAVGVLEVICSEIRMDNT